jgi:hypothetical protein
MGNCIQSYQDWKEHETKILQAQRDNQHAEKKQEIKRRGNQLIDRWEEERHRCLRNLAVLGDNISTIANSTMLVSDKKDQLKELLQQRHVTQGQLKQVQIKIGQCRGLLQKMTNQDLLTGHVKELKALSNDMASLLPQTEDMDKLASDQEDTVENLSKINEVSDELTALQDVPLDDISSFGATTTTFDYDKELTAVLHEVESKKKKTKKKKKNATFDSLLAV